MFSLFRKKLSTTIAGGAVIIAVFTIISKFLGLLRDRLIASSFGASDITDVYFASFRLPDLIFNTLVLGALASAFIPVFIKIYNKNQTQAWRITSSILNIILIVLGVLVLIFFFLAPKIVPLIVPGFDLEKQKITVELTRIMLFSILFFGASNVISSVLNSFKRFVAYSLAPIMYNLGIIFGIVVLVPRYGIWGMGLGVVAGAALHLIIQLPSAIAAGFRWQGQIALREPGVKRIALLMLPRTFGLAVNQINYIVITAIASTLIIGSVSVFQYAQNLMGFPIGIFAISLAIASFPYFSECAACGDIKGFVRQFSITLRRILYLIIPTSIFILLLRAQIVRLVLGAGQFDWADTVMTLETLGFFSFSLFAQALIPLLARSFYAFQDTKTPVIVSLISILINIFGGLYLSKTMGVAGLALAFSIASIINVILLFVILRIKLGCLDEKRIIISLFKISLLSIIAGGAVQITKHLVAPQVDMQTFVGVLTQFASASIIGVAIYLSLTLLCKCEEVSILKKLKL